jgi:hypothetical protein
MKGPHWLSCHALFTSYMKLLGDYERIAIVYDDIDATSRIWNTLFHMGDWYGLDLVHPSVAGHAATEVTAPQEGSILRYMSVVDCLAPIFTRRTLERLLPTFAEDLPESERAFRWSKLLPWPEYRSAIVDTVHVSRTVAAWGTPPRGAPKSHEHGRLRLVHEDHQETRV